MQISDLFIILILLLIFMLVLLKLFFDMQETTKDKEKLDVGACMTIGGRDVQEDQYGWVTTAAGTMAVLADGAGKTFGGRIASKLAVDTCLDIFQDYNAFHNPQYYFRKAFHAANKEILKVLEDETYGSASVGCVLIRDGYLYYAVVGNVKVGVFRDGNLVAVSSGHTVAVLAEEKFREGRLSRQDAITMLENRRLYNYLGKDDFQDIELFDAPVHLKQGDIVVLMSDGVYDLLGYKEIELILEETTTDCNEKAFKMMESVNQNTSEWKDNASIILLEARNGVKTV